MPEVETPRQMLFAAAWRGEFDEVKSLMDSQMVNVNAVDDNNVTALRFTSQYGHYQLTQYLLESGANPNIKAKDGMDPLLAAIEKGEIDIVKLLLENGANVNTRTKSTNALLLAREKGHGELTQLLIQKGASEDMGLIHKYKQKCTIA